MFPADSWRHYYGFFLTVCPREVVRYVFEALWPDSVSPRNSKANLHYVETAHLHASAQSGTHRILTRQRGGAVRWAGSAPREALSDVPNESFRTSVLRAREQKADLTHKESFPILLRRRCCCSFLSLIFFLALTLTLEHYRSALCRSLSDRLNHLTPGLGPFCIGPPSSTQACISALSDGLLRSIWNIIFPGNVFFFVIWTPSVCCHFFLRRCVYGNGNTKWAGYETRWD